MKGSSTKGNPGIHGWTLSVDSCDVRQDTEGVVLNGGGGGGEGEVKPSSSSRTTRL